jgi:hypothetical protein
MKEIELKLRDVQVIENPDSFKLEGRFLTKDKGEQVQIIVAARRVIKNEIVLVINNV